MCPLQVNYSYINNNIHFENQNNHFDINDNNKKKKKLQTFIENHTLAVRLFYPTAGAEF